MDTTPKYIEMCSKAEEIQNLMPQLQKKREENIVLKRVSNLILWEIVFRDPLPPEYKTIWLPRQDQLQEIVMKTLVGVKHPLWAMSGMFNQIFTDNGKPDEQYIATESFEQLWLIFTMKRVFNKQWNHETKQWQIIQS